MLYLKNLPRWERITRVLIGLLALTLAAVLRDGTPWLSLGAVAAAVLALTGLAGFCPMCALFGRRRLDGHAR